MSRSWREDATRILMDRAATTERPDRELLRTVAQLATANRGVREQLRALPEDDALRARLSEQRRIEARRTALYHSTPWHTNRVKLEEIEGEMRAAMAGHAPGFDVNNWFLFERALVPENGPQGNYTYEDLYNYWIQQHGLTGRDTPLMHNID